MKSFSRTESYSGAQSFLGVEGAAAAEILLLMYREISINIYKYTSGLRPLLAPIANPRFLFYMNYENSIGNYEES